MRILIVSPNWVGDLVMAQTLFIQLKKDNHYISVLAPKFLHDILCAMVEVDRIIESPLKHSYFNFREYKEFALTLKDQFDKAIVLPNSFKSALIPFLAKIPIRVGWLGESRYFILNDYKKLDKRKYPLMVERFLALKDWTLEKPYPKPFLKAKPLNERFLIKKKCKLIILCPGAEFGIAKQWFLEGWQGVAKYFSNFDYQIVILGSLKDKLFANKISQVHNNILNLAGDTNLSDVIDILNISDFVITNDSGLLHIASALDKKLIAIYGSTTFEFTPPLTENAIILKEKLSCSPCFRRTCPYHHYNCLKAITIQKVINVVENHI